MTILRATIVCLLLSRCVSLSISNPTKFLGSVQNKLIGGKIVNAIASNKALLIRGGERLLEERAHHEVANRIGDAVGIMGGIQVPAALFAGAALGTLYSPEIRNAHPQLRLSYLTLTSLAFTLQTCTVFISTIVSWRLVGGGFDPLAESGAKLLLKYFEISYLSAGAFFFGGILAFMLANTICAYINFGNSPEAHICSAMNSLSSFYLLNAFDRAMVYFDDFGHFFGRFVRVFGSALSGLRRGKTIVYLLATVGVNCLVSFMSMKHSRQLREKEKEKYKQ